MKKTTKNKSSKSSKSNPPRSLKRMFPELTSVIDSKVPLLVNVRESDCAKATSLDINHCAMAKAAQRQFKVDAVVIGIATSYLIKGKKATRFKTPESVQREIVSFDRHHDFQPGNYNLVPYSPSLRLGAYNRSGKKGGGYKQKKIIHKTSKIRAFSL